jgi:hypothetical protein
MTEASTSVLERPSTGLRSASQCSRLTNDPFALRNVSGRSAEGRRWRDLVGSYRAQFPQATADEVRALAALRLKLEQMQEAVVAMAGDVDPEALGRLSNIVARRERELQRKAPPKPAMSVRQAIAARYPAARLAPVVPPHEEAADAGKDAGEAL